MSPKNLRFPVLGLLGCLALANTAAAQVTSPKIIITNVDPDIEIPLDSTSAVQIRANGDLEVTCRLNSGNCPGTGTGDGSVGTNPPTGVSLIPSLTSIQAGQSVSLTWTSSTNTEACYAAAPTGITGWSGAVLARSGTRAVTLSTVNSSGVIFQLRCYNAGGSTLVSAAPVVVTEATTPPPPPPPGNYCEEFYDGTPAMPTGANFTAHGFTRVDAETDLWGIWAIAAGASSTTRVAMPGFMLSPSSNRYLAIPFTLTDDTGGALSQFGLDWIEANFNLGISTGAISVSISPCPGDFRPPVGGSSDPYLSAQCRKTGSVISGTMTISSVASLSGCPAPKGKQMYMNVATYNMFTTTTPTLNTCGTNGACGVSMIIQ